MTSSKKGQPENLYVSRRSALAALGAIFWLFPTKVCSQLLKTTYSEENRIKSRLQSASTFNEIKEIAQEWNEVFNGEARAHAPQYQSDWDQIVDNITGEIELSIADTAASAILKKTAPKVFAWISSVRSSFAVLSPVFVFIQASAPSEIGSDTLEVHHSNVRVQTAIRKAIDRVSGYEDWFAPIWNEIEVSSGATLRKL